MHMNYSNKLRIKKNEYEVTRSYFLWVKWTFEGATYLGKLLPALLEI